MSSSSRASSSARTCRCASTVACTAHQHKINLAVCAASTFAGPPRQTVCTLNPQPLGSWARILSRCAEHACITCMQIFVHDCREDPLRPVEVRDRPNVEADVRYRRVDYSTELAAEARLQFAACLAQGEAALPLARAALLVAAEDDAIASSSTVRFPVEAFMDRITRLAEDTAAALAAAAAEVGSSSSSSSSSGAGLDSTDSSQQWSGLRRLPPEQLVAAIEHCLFKHQQHQQQEQQQQQWYSGVRCAGFSMPAYGRSNLPKRALVDHPGVWEDARLGYLNEVLVKKRGCPAALVILYNEIMQQLLLLGAIDFAVTFDYGEYSSLPVATPLANLDVRQLILPQAAVPPPAAAAATTAATTAAAVAAHPSATVLNTCSSEALAELLRHLKRAYWPFPWDTNIDDPDRGGRGSLGGFRAAAKAALGSDDISAALRAVSATAAHRLQRGIWTSPGAGDLARCLAAAERLVMVVGDDQLQERRDLAVLLLHAGQPTAAAAELGAYLDAARAPSLAADPFDVRLAEQLWKMMVIDTGVKPDREVMSVGKILDQGMPSSTETQEETYKPLTW